MKLHLPLTFVAAVALVMASPTRATLIAGPDIIAPPPSVIDDAPGAENNHQQGFNERQGVLLGAPLAVDGGNIAAGTLVNSHMIFLNTPGSLAVTNTSTWTFDGPVLGVMSNNNGSLEINSTPLLGALGTIYPAAPFANRGFETGDTYVVAASQLTATMSVTEPGDWIRVVTRASVPDAGSTVVLLALGLGVLGGVRRWTRGRA